MSQRQPIDPYSLEPVPSNGVATRAPRYQARFGFIALLLLGSFGATFTWNKLETMKEIRGFKPGAASRTFVVRDKWLQPPSSYWISWTDQDIHLAGNHRLNLPESAWDEYEIGDEIEVVFVPGDNHPHYRDGIFANDSNFAFDYGLLGIEIAMITVGLIGTLWAAGILPSR